MLFWKGMDEKKEVQQRILIEPNASEKATEDEFYSILRLIAPGTNIRAGLNGILKAGKGAIIAIENEWLYPLVDGGFRLNSKFTPQKLIELSKMDGAIILANDLKRIVSANALLTPDSRIATSETGTRHKAAERTAKQAATLVLAVSERRNEINLYYKNLKYHISDSGELLRNANEQIQMLEKQRELFDRAVKKLSGFELRNYPSFEQAIHAIQKGYMVKKIASSLQKYVIELGKESALLKTRLKELIADVESETNLVVKDYTQVDLKKSLAFFEEFSYDDLLDKEKVRNALTLGNPLDKFVIKGWRILSKTGIPEPDIAAIIMSAGTLGKAIHSSSGFYRQILGEEKALLFKSEVDNLKLNL